MIPDDLLPGLHSFAGLAASFRELGLQFIDLGTILVDLLSKLDFISRGLLDDIDLQLSIPLPQLLVAP